MTDKLTREEVEHVAKLARIRISDSEMEKYQIELKKILDEVEKINDVVGYDDQFLIAPWSDDSTLREDESGEMLEAKEVLLNVLRHSGNYIEVPVVIGE